MCISIYIYIYILSVRRNDENVSFPFLLKRFLFVSLPFLFRFFTVSFSFLLLTVSFPFPPFLFRFFSVSFHISDVQLGAGSREGAGRTKGFHRNLRKTSINTIEPVTTTELLYM